MIILKIVHYASKAFLTMIMCMSVNMYLTKTDMVRGFFEMLSFPKYLVYPLAIAKILGLVAIWFVKFRPVKEWAFAGFFFNTLLALTAHLMNEDGGYLYSSLALIFTLVSYITWRLMDTTSK